MNSKVPVAAVSVIDYEEPTSPVRSERNLLAAVLSRAICDAFGSAKCEAHLIRAARVWLFAPLMPSKPFTFAWVARGLDLDARDLQDRLREYSKNPSEIKNKVAILRA